MIPDENDLPDEDIRRMWNEATPVMGNSTTARTRFSCRHFQISGASNAVCGICGALSSCPSSSRHWS